MTDTDQSNETTPPAASGFVGQICAYFRDFLETDFRRQKMPKRNIGLKDAKGNATGISLSKYPELAAEIWKTLGRPLDGNRQFAISIARGKYHSRVNKTLLDVVERHVAALDGEVLVALADRAKAAARELRASLENDPERYCESVLTVLRGELIRTAVAPLVLRLESGIRQQGSDEFEVAYDIEEELGARLISEAREAIGSAVATAIVENGFGELDQVINDLTEPDTVRRRISTYFQTFRTSDFFQELHELRSTLKIRENFETYLYIGSLHYSRVSYPVFYIPLQIELQERIFRITADPQIYVNKKALEFAAQETSRELQRPIPLIIKERIGYLDQGQSFLEFMQGRLDQWCADLALKPPIDLASNFEQSSQRSQLAVTNSLHFCAFDKADEALLNDYEELLTNLAAGSEVALDFKEIIETFLSRDPVNVGGDIEREWDGTPIEGRLVFQSPVPLNEEQRKILSALRHSDARFISIEGPPGTGKSHTITAIVFEAILNGQNVLVLSDKAEALDVVESKLNDVLNSVRVSDHFQNPILRLGRAGNSYGRILGGQAVEAIRAHHKASQSSQPRLIAQIKEDELRLSHALRETVDRGAAIKVANVYELHRQEDRLAEVMSAPEAIVSDGLVLDALEAVGAIAEFLSEANGAALKVLRAIFRRTTLQHVEALLQVQLPLSDLATPVGAELESIQFFSRFRKEDLATLQAIIAEFDAARWPVFGYTFARAKVRALEARLGTSLSPVNALNAHRKLDRLTKAHATFAQIGAALTRAGLSDELITIAFQQLIENLPACSKEQTAKLFDCVARVRAAVERRDDLMKQAGIDTESLDEWTAEQASVSAGKLKAVLAYADGYKRLQQSFGAIPDFDYAGGKRKLESLHAHRLAHLLDGQVIHFADNHRNLARSIRDIIRKKQQFQKDHFATMQRAFPCMIAGIRDYAEYIPLEMGLFDIIIIDEASQVSIAQAFPAFLRAKKLVVLGDRKQFSNVKTATASIEINNQYANEIIASYRDEHAPDVNTLNRLKLFNIKTSVLEFVERIANNHTMLRKHFRGYPELISFSSKTFYRGQLQAVKTRGLPIDDVIRFTRVQHDGRLEVRRNVNTAEWDEILKELRRLSQFEDAPSVGIITPFTEQQSLFVQNLHSLVDGEKLQTKLSLKVMTFDSCQGEERDVIIYSLVATPQMDKLAYIFPKNLDEAEEVDHALRMQRLNVGFSRAKERIHFFHSMPLDGYRGAIGRVLNHYIEQIGIAQKRPSAANTDSKSPMEQKLLAWLEQTRFVQMLGDRVEIDAQFELGSYLRQLDPGYRHPAYRVDFLVKVKSGRGVVSIIVEYDGFKEHFTDLERVDAHNFEDYYRPDDVERQKILEGYGYRFLRVNRFNLGKDPVKTLDARLLKLAQDAIEDVGPHQLIDEVKEAAEGLISGEKKLCLSCREVKNIEEFRAPELNGRAGRKCVACKRAEAAKKVEPQNTGSPTRRGHRQRRRTWRRW